MAIVWCLANMYKVGSKSHSCSKSALRSKVEGVKAAINKVNANANKK